MQRGDRTAWLRLNAYGVVLACLAILSLTDLVHPAGTELARLLGDVPPGQPAWVAGFGIAGILLLYGFVKADRLAETLGLALMTVGLFAQFVTALAYLGVTEFTATRLLLVAILALCAWARCSVLWSRRGLNIHIPARGEIAGETAEETGDGR
jgi:hypothetical protein